MSNYSSCAYRGVRLLLWVLPALALAQEPMRPVAPTTTQECDRYNSVMSAHVSALTQKAQVCEEQRVKNCDAHKMALADFAACMKSLDRRNLGCGGGWYNASDQCNSVAREAGCALYRWQMGLRQCQQEVQAKITRQQQEAALAEQAKQKKLEEQRIAAEKQRSVAASAASKPPSATPNAKPSASLPKVAQPAKPAQSVSPSAKPSTSTANKAQPAPATKASQAIAAPQPVQQPDSEYWANLAAILAAEKQAQEAKAAAEKQKREEAARRRVEVGQETSAAMKDPYGGSGPHPQVQTQAELVEPFPSKGSMAPEPAANAIGIVDPYSSNESGASRASLPDPGSVTSSANAYDLPKSSQDDVQGSRKKAAEVAREVGNEAADFTKELKETLAPAKSANGNALEKPLALLSESLNGAIAASQGDFPASSASLRILLSTVDRLGDTLDTLARKSSKDWLDETRYSAFDSSTYADAHQSLNELSNRLARIKQLADAALPGLQTAQTVLENPVVDGGAQAIAQTTYVAIDPMALEVLNRHLQGCSAKIDRIQQNLSLAGSDIP